MTSVRHWSWQGGGACVRGASHVRSGLPNQDAFSWQFTDSATGFTGVLAVADGHGSARSFRSDIGSRCAVQVAVELLEQFAQGFREQGSLAIIETTMQVELPKRIVQQWQEAIGQHHRAHPFGETELAKIDPASRKAVEESPSLAYGTTLLAVLLTDRFILYSQVGDGDIVVISDGGHATRPLPVDERLFANETTSLCSLGRGSSRSPVTGPAGAWSEFRMRLDARLEQPPALILVSTDGYANSFRSEADFMKVGPDLLSLIQEEGLDQVYEKLENWLSEASQAGSGDDVTLGLICRRDAVVKPGPRSPAGATVLPLSEDMEQQSAADGGAAGASVTSRRPWYRFPWSK